MDVVYCWVVKRGSRRWDEKGTCSPCQARKDPAKDSGFLVATRPGETPVPIPNTMVKPWAADGTMLGTAWESRWPPEFNKDVGL